MNEFDLFTFKAIAATANLHSTTLLLNRVPKVKSFGEGVQELVMTRHTESGILTVVVLITGINSICLAFPFSPIIEIV